MESSCCIDDSFTTDPTNRSLSTTWSHPSPALPLQRMVSGASVVTNPASSAATEPGAEVESRKLPSSQYKGVVPQPNGRWGAQIYEKHQRIWLGTFNLERDAAHAYDVAAQRFRGRDAATNFPPLSNDADELAFLLSCSKAEVVDMLRKHTYPDELRHSLRRRFPPLPATAAAKPVNSREHLFDKGLTPSDVSKLNRLVIPKQHAEKHFPLANAPKGVLLSMEDVGGGKVWRFRYSYWNSSQSYVLTKGWSRFVKEKGLKAGDKVGFYRSTGAEHHLYIDCRPRGRKANFGVLPPVKVLRLFGVNIVDATVASKTLAESLNENGKRSLESVEDGWFQQKQRVRDCRGLKFYKD